MSDIFINKAISLSSTEFQIVLDVNTERRLNNFSLAIRQIIQEWAALHSKLSPTPSVQPYINGNGHQPVADPAPVQEDPQP